MIKKSFSPNESPYLDFTVLDFETATPKRKSVCQVAICVVRGGEIIGVKSWLIQPPQNEYDSRNTWIHGISAIQTEESANFSELWTTELSDYLEGELILAHSAAFDISCLREVLAHYTLQQPRLWYGCTVQFFRALIPSLKNYKLDTLASLYNIPLQHHDAASDVEATARLVLELAKDFDIIGNDDFYKKTGYEWGQLTKLDHLPTFQRRYLRPSETQSGRWEGDISRLEDYLADGSPAEKTKKVESLAEIEQKLKGLVFVFTGELRSFLRAEAFETVAMHGGTVVSSVSKKVNYVVVGTQVSVNIGDDGLSSKERKAKDLITSGHALQIIDEIVFKKMLI